MTAGTAKGGRVMGVEREKHAVQAVHCGVRWQADGPRR